MQSKQKTLSEINGQESATDNVKLSNFFYEKIMIQKACHCAFSLMVLALQLKASYMRYKYSRYVIVDPNAPVVILTEEEQAEALAAASEADPVVEIFYDESIILEGKVKTMLLFSNLLSLFQCYNQFITYVLEMKWLKSKQQIHKDETFFTTGMYKFYIMKVMFVLVQPYWFLYGFTFKDKWNEWTKDLVFQYNDVLTVLQIFLKMAPVYIYIIELTNWTDPKAQRCCNIFGVEANFLFGLKALMIQDPILVVLYSFMFSLIQLSMSLQIFEREVDSNFRNITLAMWNVIITLTTVGYGDYYPKTNFGRCIGIITAFWGVFFVSLFVVALTNTLDLEESELRAFILLRRLFTRKILRENACKMIQSRYLIRTEERKPENERNRLKIRQNQLQYKKWQNDFQQNYQRLLTMNDQNAQNDRLQIGIDQVRQDIEGLQEQQHHIDESLHQISESFQEAKDFLIQKMASNNKWRRKYKYGKIKKMNKLYKNLQVKYSQQQESFRIANDDPKRYKQQSSDKKSPYHEGGQRQQNNDIMDADDLFEDDEQDDILLEQDSIRDYQESVKENDSVRKKKVQFQNSINSEN